MLLGLILASLLLVSALAAAQSPAETLAVERMAALLKLPPEVLRAQENR